MSDKFFNILRIALLVVGVAFGLMFFFGIQGLEDPEIVELAQTDFIAYLTYIFFGIAAVIAVIAPVIIIAKNPKNAKSILIGLVVLAGLFFLAYALSSGAIDSAVMQKKDTTETTSKFVGTGIYLTYILAGLAVFSLAVSGVTRIFK